MPTFSHNNATVIVMEKSDNSKLGGLSTTYASKGSCPKSCSLRKGGCYGDCGYVAMQWQNCKGSNPVDIAKAEAKGINTLSGKLHLRLHTIGDCSSNLTAKILASAAKKYSAKHNRQVFTFTHAWREIDRKSWGNINIIASCEKMADVKEAIKKGYKAALIVPVFKKTIPYKQNGMRLIPCPKQLDAVCGCIECGLCVNANERLKKTDVIAFKVHGPVKKARKALGWAVPE